MVHIKMPRSRPRGHDPGGSWQSAIRRNGSMPTIYPHTKHHGPIVGHPSKSDPLGKWSGGYRGKHR